MSPTVKTPVGPLGPIVPILPLLDLPVFSKWAQNPLDMDSSINHASWQGAGKMKFGQNWLLAMNDSKFAYLAFDMTQDTGNDAGTGDYFWLSFDTNRDRSISPNQDVNYGLYPGNPNKMGRQYYLGPGTWTGLVNETSESLCRMEFGPSPQLATPHRIWKMRIRLTDINVSLIPFWVQPYTYIGFRIHSNTPNLNVDFPANFFTDFSQLKKLVFSRQPAPSTADLGPVMGSVGLIPTTKILATGRATTAAGYFVVVKDAAFGGLLNIIGNGVTLQSLFAAGARKYRVFHTEPGGATFQPLVSAWANYRWNGTDYVLETFAADANQQYAMLDPTKDYSIDDLLIQFNSGEMTTGLHRFMVKFYQANGTTEVPATAQTLAMFIDNTLPLAQLDAVMHNGTPVAACSIVNLDDATTDGLNFRVSAFDPEGNLLSYSLTAGWGENQSATIYSENYSDNPHPGNLWTGVMNQLLPGSGEWKPSTTCAYSFTITSSARTTNGYSYIGYTQYSRYITLLIPSTSTLKATAKSTFPMGSPMLSK